MSSIQLLLSMIIILLWPAPAGYVVKHLKEKITRESYEMKDYLLTCLDSMCGDDEHDAIGHYKSLEVV